MFPKGPDPTSVDANSTNNKDILPNDVQCLNTYHGPLWLNLNVLLSILLILLHAPTLLLTQLLHHLLQNDSWTLVHLSMSPRIWPILHYIHHMMELMTLSSVMVKAQLSHILVLSACHLLPHPFHFLIFYVSCLWLKWSTQLILYHMQIPIQCRNWIGKITAIPF